MTTLNILEYLKVYNNFQSLETELGITIKKYDNYFLLNYSQIDSPKFHDIVKECRGIIIDNDLNVLCKSFDRFFNYNEDPNTEQFPITNAIVWEKIDGSLVRIWWNKYLNKWTISTRGMAHAEGNVSNNTYTFEEIILQTLNNSYDIFDNLSKDNTYIFELVSPETRVVKPYGDKRLYLIGCINNITFEEYDYEYLYNLSLKINISLPQTYKLDNINDIVNSFKDMPTFDEGYVCAVYNYPSKGKCWRLKIKNPSYLAIAHLRNNGCVSKKRICILVLSNDEEEYLNYFPEDQNIFQPYIDGRNKLFSEISEVWNSINHIIDQKEFALMATKHHFSSILFLMRKGKTIDEIIEKSTDNFKLKLIEPYINSIQTLERVLME